MTEEPTSPKPSGDVPILVTPFTPDEDLDLGALRDEVRYLADAGVRWVGFGFGSEIQRLTPEEAHSIVREARAADPRVHVIGNSEATSIRTARASISRLREDGADAVLVRPPASPGLGADRLAEAFRLIADGAALPLIVQDAADMTGVPLSAALIAGLLDDSPAIIGAKIESRDAADKIAELRGTHPAAVILGGSGGAGYARQLARGADGTMPGPAFPDLFAAIHAAHRSGDRREARRVQALLLPYLQIGELNIDTFIYTQKLALVRQGVLRSTVLRRPNALVVDQRLDDELAALIEDIEGAL